MFMRHVSARDLDGCGRLWTLLKLWTNGGLSVDDVRFGYADVRWPVSAPLPTLYRYPKTDVPDPVVAGIGH